jgi:hypothetical protein
MDDSQLESLAARATGDSVTVGGLEQAVGGTPLYRYADKSEQVHFLLRGSVLDIVDSTVPDSANGRKRRKVPSAGAALVTLVTDQQVCMIVPRGDDSERLAVSLRDIERATAESAPGGNERLAVHASETVYYIDTSHSIADETEAAATFLTDHEKVGSPPEASRRDPLEALERLADLHQRDVLTDAEFEEKKRELLDRI